MLQHSLACLCYFAHELQDLTLLCWFFLLFSCQTYFISSSIQQWIYARLIMKRKWCGFRIRKTAIFATGAVSNVRLLPLLRLMVVSCFDFVVSVPLVDVGFLFRSHFIASTVWTILTRMCQISVWIFRFDGFSSGDEISHSNTVQTHKHYG